MAFNQFVLPKAVRVEVIDATGRAFVRYYEAEAAGVTISVQDDDATIKIFAGTPRQTEGIA